MPRRKQSRPRPVKASGQADDVTVVDYRNVECDEDSNIHRRGESRIIDRSKPATTRSTERDDADDDVVKDSQKINDDIRVCETSSHCEPSSSLCYVSEKLVLPSLAPAKSDPLRTSMPAPLFPSVNEMARCDRLPKNITWNHQAVTQVDIKGDKCVLCSTQQQQGVELKPLVEGKDYFIDSDGTVAIRNGVCPRSLALSLFCEVFANSSKYSKLLGENLVKFLLNLRQIMAEHKKICPGEDPTDFKKAQNVLNSFSYIINEPREQTNGAEEGVTENNLHKIKGRKIKNMEKSIISSDTHDCSFSDASQESPLLHRLSLSKEKNMASVLSRSLSPEQNLAAGNSGSDFVGSNKHEVSDSGSTESSSHVTSPSPSLSSMTSGPSASDKSKQMTSTKRGCKILPVAVTGGQSLYLCPVCSLELSSDHELTVHIRSHNQSSQQSVPNTCTICGKTLSSQSSLDRHMLVHSGERPFKCKICDMSFTTNGNMHRHARIHEKNGVLAPRPSNRKPVDDKGSSKESLFYQEDSSSAQTGKSSSLASGFGSDKIDFVSSQQLQEQNMFMQQYYRFLLPYGTSHHPAFPYSQFMQHPARMTLPFFQAVVDPLTIGSLMKYARHAVPVLPEVREPSPDLRAQQKFNCTECDTVFTNQFSLESHMETHVIVDEELEAESASACKSCKTVAKSEASLLLHYLKYHKTDNEAAVPDTVLDDKCPSEATVTTGSSTVSAHSCTNAVGFQSLGFADFTTKKFPLIAKAFCESNPSTRAHKFPVYRCGNCQQEFPVEGAKHLHEASHEPEEYTACPECECHFSEPARLQRHMQKHVADLKFEESRGQTDLDPNVLAQYHFLALFGLTPKEETEESVVKIECENADICAKDEMMVSDNEDSKMMHSDSDDSESVGASCGEMTTSGCEVPLYQNLPHHKSPADPAACGSNSSALLSFKDSQNLSQHSEGFPSQAQKLSAFGTSVSSDCSQKFQDGPSEVSQIAVPPVFPCKYCNLELTSPRALKYHLCTHKNTSQFQCKVCNYSSTDKNTLFRHMRTHSGERPYKCVICEYSFTTKANCERHLRQKHGLDKSQVADKLAYNKHIIANKHSQLSEPGRNSVRFQNQSTFAKVHGAFGLSSRHQPLLTSPDNHAHYECKACTVTFSSYNSMLHHVSRCHPDIAETETLPASLKSGLGRNLEAVQAMIASPPPAHVRSPVPSTLATKCLPLDKLVIKQEYDLPDPADGDAVPDDKQLSSKFRFTEDWTSRPSLKEPLDFSKHQKHRISVKPGELERMLKKSYASSYGMSEGDHSAEVVPVDLSVSRTSRISPFITDPDQTSKIQGSRNLLPLTSQKSAFRSVVRQSFHDSGDVLSNSSPAENDTDDSVDYSSAGIPTVVSNKSPAPAESDSSCELASVNKILDATDAQKFQNYLLLPESEDHQEDGMESMSSDGDSDLSMGYMSSSLQSEVSRNPSEAGHPGSILEKEKAEKSSVRLIDASNMSQKAIAELIEKVSQEGGSPAKKKKNSYADSPHKFSCQFCPRCFPWQSSLNRHLLTHTGQKPFKCPRCPVTFSTKSNRERHLIRKHNVNMLDPASRSTMDRPYKCHICMFSSFSTKSNLFKHYKDKHSGIVPPKQSLGPDKQQHAGDWEDSLVNGGGGGSSYEDDEEYNTVAEMQGGVTDKEVMFENYKQDTDTNSLLYQDFPKKPKILHTYMSAESHRNDSSKTNSKLSKRSAHIMSSDIASQMEVDNAVLTGRDKKIVQAIKNSHGKTFEERSALITNTTADQGVPVIEGKSVGISGNRLIQCRNCDQAFPSHKLLARHLKNQCNGLPFMCSFCEASFSSRVECLQHYEHVHQEKWLVLKERNEIQNVQVFAARLNKMIDKRSKKLREFAGSREKEVWTLPSKMNGSPPKSKNGLEKATTANVTLHKGRLQVNPDVNKVEANGFVVNGFGSDMGHEGLIQAARKFHCALCPCRLDSLEELKQHMHSHAGEQNLQSEEAEIEITFMRAGSSTKTNMNGSNNDSPGDSSLDMLHNLLGVESSTIDQIFEATASAASLLGVCP